MEIIRGSRIGSQEELLQCLQQQGVAVTQSTLSRDIRELGLVKVRGCYLAPGNYAPAPPDTQLQRSFSQYIVRIGASGNMLMIKTSPGNAHSIGVVLDAAQWPEVLGTIAGDDTVFVLLRASRHAKVVLERIEGLRLGG